MDKPVYEIPVTDSPGVPFAAPSAPPSADVAAESGQLYTSPPPTHTPDGDPVSGATPGIPSAAFDAPPAVAPEAAFPPPMSSPVTMADLSDLPAPSAPAGSSFDAPAPTSAAFDAPAPASMPFDAPAPVAVAVATAPPMAPSFSLPEPPAPVDALDPIEIEILSPAAAGGRAADFDLDVDLDLDAHPITATAVDFGSDDDVADLNPGDRIAHPAILAAMQEVLRTGASDLHVASGSQPLLRIDGHLSPIEGSEVWSRAFVREVLFSLLSEKMRDTFDEKLELDWAYTLSANARFRANYYQDRGAMGAAFRIIPTQIKTLKELGINPNVGQFSTLPRGLVLVTGPTGSGKSTTLAAMIDEVNDTRRDHVVTVEDPIEFMHKNKKALINQREVGRDTHSFANALKHVLRQDPDVILIGELRDLETISIALTAAETGHLVFATLHTQSAPTTIDRVIDVFPPHQQDQVRTQLAATLQGVVCQTLVKRASGSGRAVATEVMFTTPAISNLIREGKTYQITSVLQSGSAQGMHTMDQALADLVNEGVITRAVAVEKSQDPETLERLITRVDMNAGNEAGFVNLDFAVDAHGKQQGGRH